MNKKSIIYIISIIVVFIIVIICFSKCYNNTKSAYNNNLLALNDTIKYYKGKNDELVAQKLLFEGELSDLKLLNADLYNKIENLNLENKKLQNIVDFSGTIENEPSDTFFITSKDSLLNGKIYDFNFTNNYRTLEGYTQFLNDSLKVSINKDIVYFEYTVAIDENNNVYINSDNPYVKYNQISGLTIKKQKEDKFIIGPTLGIGLTSDLKIRPYIGVGITYKLLGF